MPVRRQISNAMQNGQKTHLVNISDSEDCGSGEKSFLARRSVGPYIGYPHAQQERTTGGAAEVCCAFVNSLAGSLAFSLPPSPFLPRFGLWPPFDVLEENFVFERASQTSVEVGLLA